MPFNPMDAGQPPPNSIDQESTERMLVEGVGADPMSEGTYGSSDGEDQLYPEANPLFDTMGEQKLSEFFDPGEMPGGALDPAMMQEAPGEPQGADRAGMHQALVDQFSKVKENSEGYQDEIVEQNAQTNNTYNM